jgi:alkanesulfonate monooxygenase
VERHLEGEGEPGDGDRRCPEQVAGELLAYWQLGIDEFILSGFPHEEECRRVASQVLPPLRAAIDRQRRP